MRTSNGKYRVALVTHATSGGVWSVVSFLEDVLRHSERYEPSVIVLATSARDEASVRLLSPRTWLQGARVIPWERSDGHVCQLVGAFLTEFEFQRYAPRAILTELLQAYDLVQVVGGTPAWAGVTRQLTKPTCLFAATIAELERVAVQRRTTGWRRYWLQAMTRVTASIDRQALPRAASVFAESDYTRQLLAAYVEPARLHLGPPGVDTAFFLPNACYSADGYITVVGRLSDPRKNVRGLMAAYAILRKAMAVVPRLVLAGRTGPADEDMTYATRLGIDDAIDVLTNLSADQLRNLYQGAALFVLSSDEEGLGIVILEAMACGLPVVSTDCGGPATAVQHGVTGLLTPVGNAQKLAEAMRELLEDPVRRKQMSAAGRERAERSFSLEVAGRVYLDQYDKLLGQRS